MKSFPLKASLAVACLTVFAGMTSADPQYVKLRIKNNADSNIQVYVVDQITKKTYENKDDATPGGVIEQKASVDKGKVNFRLSILYRAKSGSYYRCMDVSTATEGKSQLSYDVTTQSGVKC